MSDSAKIIIVGVSKESLLLEIEKIKLWYNGNDWPIKVAVDHSEYGEYVMDKITIVENAIKHNLSEYIEKNFPNPDLVIKSGGNNDLYLVDNPDKFNLEGKRIKHRKPTNFTAPKKKRK